MRDHASIGKRAPGAQPSERGPAVPGRVSSAAEVYATAAEATRGAGSALPHLDQIQRAFGRHEIDHVQAHVGEGAGAGARALGAEAFAFGDRVAFDGAPSLHTAAHEAAHVVQQRAGVQLRGGVGEAGDRHEAHADAVAARVVEGRSAEDLLDEYSPARGSAAPLAAGPMGVQRKEVRAATASSVKATSDDLVGERSSPSDKANTSIESISPDLARAFSVSTTTVYATPEHDQTGWGFLVRADKAEALRVELESRHYPGIAWEVRKLAPKLAWDPTVYWLIRPIAQAIEPGVPAMSPGDCYRKCLHTMNVVAAEAVFSDDLGNDVVIDVFDAKMKLMEDAFGSQIDPAYYEHKERYLAARAVGKAYIEHAQMDALLLKPYASLEPEAKDAFDRKHRINRYAVPGEQGGMITFTDKSSATKDYQFHAGGVLAHESGGTDIVTWENFANWAKDYGQDDVAKQAAQTDYAVFKMYSTVPDSGQTFHDEIGLGGATFEGQQEAKSEYGSTPITFAIRNRSPTTPPRLGPSDASTTATTSTTTTTTTSNDNNNNNNNAVVYPLGPGGPSSLATDRSDPYIDASTASDIHDPRNYDLSSLNGWFPSNRGLDHGHSSEDPYWTSNHNSPPSPEFDIDSYLNLDAIDDLKNEKSASLPSTSASPSSSSMGYPLAPSNTITNRPPSTSYPPVPSSMGYPPVSSSMGYPPMSSSMGYPPMSSSMGYPPVPSSTGYPPVLSSPSSTTLSNNNNNNNLPSKILPSPWASSRDDAAAESRERNDSSSRKRDRSEIATDGETKKSRDVRRIDHMQLFLEAGIGAFQGAEYVHDGVHWIIEEFDDDVVVVRRVS